jgi:hypothetical protein
LGASGTYEVAEIIEGFVVPREEAVVLPEFDEEEMLFSPKVAIFSAATATTSLSTPTT